MALSDPITVTVNAVPQVMPRVLTDGKHALYQKSDESYTLDIRHTNLTRDKKSRVRSLVIFTQRAAVPDPLTAVNDWETHSVSVQFDRPSVGFDATQINHVLVGLKTWLDATIAGKLFGQES